MGTAGTWVAPAFRSLGGASYIRNNYELTGSRVLSIGLCIKKAPRSMKTTGQLCDK
eukprot:COSAG02_NODE_29026_length_577_cov_1.062762_2_plen_56_part_00